MTHEQKAKELIEKFKNIEILMEVPDNESPGNPWVSEGSMKTNDAKACALICVGEIINELEMLSKPEYTIFFEVHPTIKTWNGYEKIEYWQSVKEHINQTK